MGTHSRRKRVLAQLLAFVGFALVLRSAEAAPTPTPAPLSRPILWGHCKTTAITSTATPPTIQRELQDMWDNGGRCVRIDNDWTDAIDAAHAVGFTNLVLVVGGTMRSVGSSGAQWGLPTRRSGTDSRCSCWC